MILDYAAAWCQSCLTEFVIQDFDFNHAEDCPDCSLPFSSRNVDGLTLEEFSLAIAEGVEEI